MRSRINVTYSGTRRVNQESQVFIRRQSRPSIACRSGCVDYAREVLDRMCGILLISHDDHLVQRYTHFSRRFLGILDERQLGDDCPSP
jgi:hypothetical protein